MEPIDINKIRGVWFEQDDRLPVGYPSGAGDDTIQSIKMVAEKVNEIIRFLEK
jgi:hypothetical protein